MSATHTEIESSMTPGQAMAGRHDLWLCDVWGVIHNGIAAFPPAVDALRRYRATGGTVVLITNAPRPSEPVRAQLTGLGVPADAYDELVTSGDVTRELIKAQPGAALFHLGPPRDLPLLQGLPNPVVDEKEAELCLLSGALDDEAETEDDYMEQLGRMLARGVRMYCANPDLVVQRGDRLVICAGSIAKRYEEMGGEVVIAGKPRAPIYEAAIAKAAAIRGSDVPRENILAVGDGLPTDIRGAAAQDLDVYFITGGIHGAELGDLAAPGGVDAVAAKVRDMFPGIRLAAICDELRWT